MTKTSNWNKGQKDYQNTDIYINSSPKLICGNTDWELPSHILSHNRSEWENNKLLVCYFPEQQTNGSVMENRKLREDLIYNKGGTTNCWEGQGFQKIRFGKLIPCVKKMKP